MRSESQQFDVLRQLLRPPGRGIPTLSAGGDYAAALLNGMYNATGDRPTAEIWSESLIGIPDASVILFGIPSDAGAGFVRGAAFGPLGIRTAWHHRYKGYPDGVLDIGDVLCLPQILHDDMLTNEQIVDIRREVFEDNDSSLPVSPLSIAARVVSEIRSLNRNARLVMLGGDHGVTWPVMDVLTSDPDDKDIGVLQLDAHTDLSSHRFGIRHCYNTWAYHTLQRLQPNHMVQVGLRASTQTKSQWMNQLAVVQFWADEIHEAPNHVIEAIVRHFEDLGIQSLYVTNDIDGTDPQYAPATGTPEPGGMTPEFVAELMSRIGEAFSIIGADVVEVAPPLSGSMNFRNDRTCAMAAEYLQQHLLTAAR